MNRRQFLASVAAVSAAGRLQGAGRLPIRKGVLISMLPKEMSYADRMKLAKDVGFQSVEGMTINDPREAEEIKKAADGAGLPIHSVMNMGHWENPLSSDDPAVVDKSLAIMRTSMGNAKLWGADTVLLVPAVVNPKTSYKDAWTRSQLAIRKLIPLAEQYKVIIAIEEVWNKFLVSPLEFAKYVDEFNSPWIKAYFDVGNIVFYGYPQDWIRVLGKRIVKLHIKDFAFKQGRTEWTNLKEGQIDWKAVYDALAEIGYKGDATVELRSGDEAYLRGVSQKLDQILEGA
jgi:L-ribulose-5-phosphate 3-epimerase